MVNGQQEPAVMSLVQKKRFLLSVPVPKYVDTLGSIRTKSLSTWLSPPMKRSVQRHHKILLLRLVFQTGIILSATAGVINQFLMGNLHTADTKSELLIILPTLGFPSGMDIFT